jgi:hypothetical protein
MTLETALGRHRPEMRAADVVRTTTPRCARCSIALHHDRAPASGRTALLDAWMGQLIRDPALVGPGPCLARAGSRTTAPCRGGATEDFLEFPPSREEALRSVRASRSRSALRDR